MRSFDWLSVSTALARIGRWFETARQSLLARRPLVRWSLAAVVVSILILAGYLGTASLAPAGSSYLASGRRFSPDDLVKVRRALERQQHRLPRPTIRRRVAVSADEFELASAAIAKLELGPRSLDDLRDLSAGSSVFESPHDRELRQQQRQEKILESLINELPGIVGSFVLINRPSERWGLRPAAKPTVFVSLETEEDRQLPFRTVQSITTNLTGALPGLSAEAITVVDRRGHKYLDAGNPALSALSHSRAREEELSQEILEQLDWIKGVRVSVQLPGAGASALSPVPAGDSSQKREPTRTAASGDTEQARISGQAPIRGLAEPASAALAQDSLVCDQPPLDARSAASPARRRSAGRPERGGLRLDRFSRGSSHAPATSLAGDPAPRENPAAVGPRLGQGAEKLLLHRQQPSRPQGTLAGRLAKAGRQNRGADPDGARAGCAAVWPAGVEDHDRPDPRRGSLESSSDRIAVTRLAAAGARLGNRRRHGGHGRGAGHAGSLAGERSTTIRPDRARAWRRRTALSSRIRRDDRSLGASPGVRSPQPRVGAERPRALDKPGS